jgi:hypothetical protein
MPRLLLRLSLWLLLSMFAVAADAQTRAWLDRDHIALGETTTLNIQTDQATVSSPDYTPLQPDFDVSGNSSSRQFELINGAASQKVLFAVALRARRDGVITVPSLRVGNQRTQPLALTVSAQAAAPAQGGAVFIETQVDAGQPYVQQAVGYTVRLYSATPLVSGQLDQDAPDGASLQRIGDDTQYTRDIDGRTYKVIERHYLLIPERSGALTIPGARFEGTAAGGFFDDFMGDGERELHAGSAPRRIDVRAIPAGAQSAWLPLQALGLRYLSTPQAARAGEATSITVEMTADGATATQLPELQLSAGGGAQVFADPAQSDDRFANGRPQARVVRKFSIVPAHAGDLRISGPRLSWWDADSGIARVATLPDLMVHVAAGAGTTGNAAATTSPTPAHRDEGDGSVVVPGVQGRVRPWALACVGFALLWLVTLAWALQRRSAQSMPSPDALVPRTRVGATLADLRRVLDHGDLSDVADALVSMATPQVADLDALKARLDDPAQLAAIEALQQARWRDGDGVTARARLRDAFRAGPAWKKPPRSPDTVLPPLYPE